MYQLQGGASTAPVGGHWQKLALLVETQVSGALQQVSASDWPVFADYLVL
jgi:hypothetical protein